MKTLLNIDHLALRGTASKWARFLCPNSNCWAQEDQLQFIIIKSSLLYWSYNFDFNERHQIFHSNCTQWKHRYWNKKMCTSKFSRNRYLRLKPKANFSKHQNGKNKFNEVQFYFWILRISLENSSKIGNCSKITLQNIS